MDQVNLYLDPVLRWVHVVAGILWIGMLYFFNFVNGPFAKTLDADTRKKVVPELMPRALYFFRWGAAWTWVSGFLLLALVYYHGAQMVEAEHADGKIVALAAGFLGLFVFALGYDLLWKSALAKKETVGVAVSFVLIVAVLAGLYHGAHLSARALFIHLGAMFGTTMAFNVWFRIWPLQRKIVGAIKAGQAPDPAWPAAAALRSKHNTFMSVPLVFFMLAQHDIGFFSLPEGMPWIAAAAIVGLAWLKVRWLYKKSAGASPTQI